MEETFWKQFMTTGRIEDYLQFKGLADTKGWVKGLEKEVKKGERPDAGIGKCNSHCT